MSKARLDTCPMCRRLTWWRVGERVALLMNERGRVVGLDCDSCGGWADDHELVGEDQVNEFDSIGFRATARPGGRRESERSASELDAVGHQHSPLPSARTRSTRSDLEDPNAA